MWKNDKKDNLGILLILFASIAVRIIPANFIKVNLAADSLVYERLALAINNWGILSGAMLKNFPITDHPIYPLFLSLIYYAFGHSHFIVFVFQSIIGGLLSVLIYSIAMEFFGSKVAVLSGVIACLYPIFIKLPTMLLTENLFVFLFTFFILMVIKYMKKRNLYYLISAAILLGIATLTRSVAILFFPMVMLHLFLYCKNKLKLKTNIINLFTFLIVFICSILPWSIRNYHVSGGSIIPVTEASDRGLYVSFCPYKGKIFGIRPDNDPVMVEARKIESFDERRKFFFSKIVESIKNNPKNLIKLEMLKIAYLWSPFSWEILGDGEARYNFGFVFIMPFFIYGTALLLKRKRPQDLILFLPILYFQSIHLIYFSLPRFRIGFEPLLIIIAAYAIYSIYSRVLQKRLYLFALLIFLIANVVLFLNSSEAKIALREICQMIRLW